MPTEAQKLIDLELCSFYGKYQRQFVGLEDREALIGAKANELTLQVGFLTPFDWSDASNGLIPKGIVFDNQLIFDLPVR